MHPNRSSRATSPLVDVMVLEQQQIIMCSYFVDYMFESKFYNNAKEGV